jgi:hypothetical protein
MLGERNTTGPLQQSEERDQFIPVRKSDVLNALLRHGLLTDHDEQARFSQFCRLLGSVFHYEYFDRLETLRDGYYYFNPEIGREGRVDQHQLNQTRVELLATLESVLKGANYVEIQLADVHREHTDRQALRIKVDAPMEDYHQIRFFRRGNHKEPVDVRKWFGLRSHVVETWVYDNIVLMVTIKHAGEITSKGHLKRLERSQLRPGSILIKYFRNIAHSDLAMLFPTVRVKMSALDKLTIAVPALAGGIPLLINLVPTLTVLFLVAGFYLGISGAVDPDDTVKAFAALTGLGALAGLIMRQRLKYERMSLKYQKKISDHFYFRNISNNAGIFDYIVGTAEEQECKEAFLAYYFLLIAEVQPDQATLDAAIEQWLNGTFGIDIDFEVHDALAKLERLGLLRREAGKLSVLPLSEALIVLDRKWDNFFPFSNALEIDPRERLDA